jgi:hypothetical protein
VIHGSNNDVNRALAACGASPMPYWNLEDLNRVAPKLSPMISSTHAFPLLLEALPKVGQIPIVGATPEQPIAPFSEGPSPLPAASERMELFVAPRRKPTQGFKPDVPTETPIAVPLRDLQPSRKTLSNVFRTLSAAGPMRGTRAVAATGLQDIFGRL